MKKVLITGVAGFIGSNLLDRVIAETDWMVDGIDNLSTGNKDNIEHHLGNDRLQFTQGDLADLTTLKPYDIVFHLAALPRIQPSFELINEHIVANLNTAIHLVELMIKEDHYPRLVYSGSSAIYGTPLHTPTTEEERIDCISPYAFQKYEVEKYLELISTRFPLNYVTLRYFNPYGPRSFNAKNPFNAYSSVVGIFLNKQKNGEPLTITGDGQQMRDFIHVQDLADANIKAGLHPEKINTFFNIGYGETISINEMANMISDNQVYIEKRDGEAEITHADISKAKEILNWTPSCSLAEYLAEEV
ncbi:NAD-dependent epimerase/dehydratase family protein [bacterium SCSIO 12741]|nr:NAD-dependent epimerase/dehydratase family protein [bacterium SCSIO 12741]